MLTIWPFLSLKFRAILAGRVKYEISIIAPPPKRSVARLLDYQTTRECGLCGFSWEDGGAISRWFKFFQ